MVEAGVLAGLDLAYPVQGYAARGVGDLALAEAASFARLAQTRSARSREASTTTQLVVER